MKKNIFATLRHITALILIAAFALSATSCTAALLGGSGEGSQSDSQQSTSQVPDVELDASSGRYR